MNSVALTVSFTLILGPIFLSSSAEERLIPVVQERHFDDMEAVVFSPDGKTTLTCSSHAMIHWDLTSAKIVGKQFYNDWDSYCRAFGESSFTI